MNAPPTYIEGNRVNLAYAERIVRCAPATIWTTHVSARVSRTAD